MNRIVGILIGVVAGVISSIGAAVIQAALLTSRFVTLGKSGPSFGTGLLVVMITGAIVGAITGVVIPDLFKRKKNPNP